MTLTSHHNALPAGTVLMEYRLTGLLGAGAFGITYLARDTHLDKDVAIKEYLPSACAARVADGSVVPITEQQAQDYRWGLERFSLEARTLARFSHPHIVRVNRYFEANGTGYMVMDYERGESLKHYAQSHPPLSETAIEGIIAPLLDGERRSPGRPERARSGSTWPTLPARGGSGTACEALGPAAASTWRRSWRRCTRRRCWSKGCGGRAVT